MSIERINKLLKKNKKAEALVELIQLVRTDYENPKLLSMFVTLAQSMNKSKIMEPHILLCAFIDQLVREKRLSDAVPLAAYVYRSMPQYPEPSRLMTIICEKLGDTKKAQTYAERLCLIEPNNPSNFSFLGRIKRANKDMQGALDCFNRAIGMDQNNEQLLSELGIFLFEVSEYKQAAKVYEKLYDLYPENKMGAANLVISLMAQGKLQEGLDVCKKADAHQSRNGYYLDAKAKIMLEAGLIDEALACSEKAVQLTPDKDTFKATLSHVYLAAGRLREGFENYKYRFSKDMVGGVIMAETDMPLLTRRADIKGSHIFVRSEQGFGDTLNFCRLIMLVVEEGGQVTFGVQKPLVKLMEEAFPQVKVIENSETPEQANFQCPLLDIAALFRIGLEDLPIMENYISPQKSYAEKWTGILGKQTKLRVGLTWSGGTATRHDRRRTIPLDKFLTALPEGPEYISLQKEVRDYDLETLAAHPEIRHFGPQLEDFRDTAALVDLVDLVVCVDTSIVHLSGAMGKETWLLMPFKPDFRWLYDREDSPWYPSLRLLRQQTHDVWEPVLERVHNDLKKHLAEAELKNAS